MTRLWNYLFNYRMRALIRKEFAQTRHDRKLMFSLTVLPVVQLTLVGFALSAAVTNVRLAVVDDSRSPESRELIATFTESKSFRLAGYYSSVDQLGDAVSQGKADAGMVVPYDYARDLLRDRHTTIQFLLNATNANTATISRGYAESIIQRFNTGLEGEGIHVRVQPIDGSNLARRGQAQLEPAFLYNPGLVNSFLMRGSNKAFLILVNRRKTVRACNSSNVIQLVLDELHGHRHRGTAVGGPGWGSNGGLGDCGCRAEQQRECGDVDGFCHHSLSLERVFGHPVGLDLGLRGLRLLGSQQGSNVGLVAGLIAGRARRWRDGRLRRARKSVLALLVMQLLQTAVQLGAEGIFHFLHFVER
jgi:hypothetical protein